MVVFGTRPEAIKLAPVIKALKARPDDFQTSVCSTAQHRQMLDQVLRTFDIIPDMDLDVMQSNQTLAGLTSRTIEGMNEVFRKHRTDCIIVQGDTTTSMTSALCAFYHGIGVAHVEAGLRTNNKHHPFPEEINRRLTSQIADLHFAPTELARKNLIEGGIHPESIFVTGNTVVDALLEAAGMIKGDELTNCGIPAQALLKKKVVLITGHRRENFGEGFRSICLAILSLAKSFRDVAFIYPVHLNPNVRKTVHEMLSDTENIFLTDPLGYLPFIALLQKSHLVLTDSGGIQEEAPSFGKPVIVMRETTERPEAVTCGTAKLVGTNTERIVEEVSALLKNKEYYDSMSKKKNPFGDGTASEKIVEILRKVSLPLWR
ncbi:MAG: UDP-N-acetylglucosamine 2-epimerase (non-hydrolyzing) [Desulfobacteraceae bacterium]|nr:MAG: UDP-N-acetylglucosamine 2-epimerase (non-hydrolyzing) [Desulfobacteraceae bacterium]